MEGLADLVDKQHDFLCGLNDRVLLDMEREELVEVVLGIVVIFASYARGEIVSPLICVYHCPLMPASFFQPFDKLNARLGPRICKLKRVLLRNNDFADLRNMVSHSVVLCPLPLS